MTDNGSTAPAPPIVFDGEQDLVAEADEVRVAGFEPDARHWAYLEAVTRSDKPLSLTDLALAIDVPKSTVFDWERNPNFQEWVAIHREIVFKHLIQDGWQQCFREMMKGSAAHTRMFMRRFDPKFEPGKNKPEADEGEGKVSSSAVIEFIRIRARCSKEEVLKLLTGRASIALKE